MNIDDFFTFSSKFLSSGFQALAVDLRYDDDEKLLIGEYDDILFPVKFKHDSGGKMYDILNTGSVILYVISDKMKTILEENKLTGWKTYSIKLLDKKNNELFGYHGFSVVGKCGPVDWSKSQIIERKLVPTGPVCQLYKELHVGLDTWDGTDFFIYEGSFGIIVTKKTAEILKKNKTTNVELQNLSDFEDVIC